MLGAILAARWGTVGEGNSKGWAKKSQGFGNMGKRDDPRPPFSKPVSQHQPEKIKKK
jgi:hypothetical protein